MIRIRGALYRAGQFHSCAICWLLLLALGHPSYGQKSTLIDSNSLIKNVKLFSKGASIYRTSSGLSLNEGLNRVEISGVSASIFSESIKVYPEKDLQVLNSSIRIDSLGFKDIPIYRKIADSLFATRERIRSVGSNINRYQELRKILLDNRNIRVSDRSIYIDDLEELLLFFDRRLKRYNTVIDSLTRHQKKLIDNRERLVTAKRKTVTTLGYPRATVILLLRAQTDMNTQLQISYSVRNAGWHPRYSINALPSSKEMSIIGWAEVFQNTGQDWMNVPVEFMTGYVDDLSFTDGAAGDLIADTLSDKSRITRIAATSAPITIRNGVENELTFLFEEKHKGEVINYCYPSKQERVYVNVAGTGLVGSYYPKGEAALSINNNYLRTLLIHKAPYQDSASFSLGVNDDFTVRRVLDKDKFRKSLLGSTIKQEVLFTLYLTNNSNKEAEIVVYDKLPRTQKSAVEVNYNVPRGANVNENMGFFLLRSKIVAGETIEINYGYKLSYPKGHEIKNYQELNH